MTIRKERLTGSWDLIYMNLQQGYRHAQGPDKLNQTSLSFCGFFFWFKELIYLIHVNI